MTRLLSLAHLTVLGLPPPAMIRLAARCGYGAVGLRLIAVTPATPGYDLARDPVMMRETLAALADTGLRVLDVEFVRIAPGFDARALDPMLEAAARLGARHVICAPYEPDPGRLAAGLAAMGERAAAHGLSAVLEFFPWTVVPGLADALRVVRAAGRDDIGILVDALHLDRSDSPLVLLDGAPLPFLHLCDAPRRPPYDEAALLHAGRAERLPPGEGEIALGALLAAAPPGIPLALEVPMAALAAEQGYEAVARRAIAGAQRLLQA